jgi:hypothetical protein
MRIIRDVRWQQSLEVDYAGQDRNCLLGGHYYRAGTVRGWLGWKHGARLSTITHHDSRRDEHGRKQRGAGVERRGDPLPLTASTPSGFAELRLGLRA